MIKKATENLGVVENVKLVQTDLLNIESANMPINLMQYSLCRFALDMDHYKVFENFYCPLNPGGEILIRC